jgi:hypothetical protein
MQRLNPGARRRSSIIFGVLASVALVVAACGGSATPTPRTPGPAAGSSTAPSTSGQASASAAGGASSTPADTSPAESQAPDASGGTTSGDVPDNAVYLTYHQATLGFSIKYVEGWQVTTQADGVVIRDKDSSETVTMVRTTADPAAYASGTDLPSLQAQAGFKLIKQDTVKVGAQTYVHIACHIPSPPDPVTGKQVPLTVDRYYVPGSGSIAVVSLASPDGVDNVDAFRLMIESFKWS